MICSDKVLFSRLACVRPYFSRRLPMEILTSALLNEGVPADKAEYRATIGTRIPKHEMASAS